MATSRIMITESSNLFVISLKEEIGQNIVCFVKSNTIAILVIKRRQKQVRFLFQITYCHCNLFNKMPMTLWHIQLDPLCSETLL